MNVSVLVLTHNEEANIAACLDSVAWSDDIVVLDSGSTDGTLGLSEARGTRILHRSFDTFADQRNFGIDHGEWRHDWILHLDADERVPEALRRELEQISDDGSKAAYRVASKMMFMGQWLKHAGMYPVYQVRFGLRGRLRFRQVGHGQQEALPPEELGTLQEPLVHEAFSKGAAEWIERHNRYSTDEARAYASGTSHLHWRELLSRDPVTRRRALKRAAQRVPCRASARFVYMWLLRGGVLDGRAGWHYCRLMAWYEYMIALKTREFRQLRM